MFVIVVQMSAESATCAWVQCLRFVRRAQSLKDARQTFLKASKVPDIGWQVCSSQSCVCLLSGRQQLRQEARQSSLTCVSPAANLLLHTLHYNCALMSQHNYLLASCCEARKLAAAAYLQHRLSQTSTPFSQQLSKPFRLLSIGSLWLYDGALLYTSNTQHALEHDSLCSDAHIPTQVVYLSVVHQPSSKMKQSSCFSL